MTWFKRNASGRTISQATVFDIVAVDGVGVVAFHHLRDTDYTVGRVIVDDFGALQKIDAKSEAGNTRCRKSVAEDVALGSSLGRAFGWRVEYSPDRQMRIAGAALYRAAGVCCQLLFMKHESRVWLWLLRSSR